MLRLSPILLLACLSWGCNNSAGGDPDLKAPEPKGAKTAAAWPTEVKIHKNEKGEVVCPIMKDAIASPDKAVGFQDYEGVRYYFCCNMCPEKFKSDPKQYAEK